MDAPPAVQSAPVLGEPFGQLHSQTEVLAHSFGVGLVSGSQPDAVQPTKPGVPDLPAATPHFVAHPVGSVRSHVPQSAVLRHVFRLGLISALQVDVLQVTAPGVPVPAPTPHRVAHPVGSAWIQLPQSTLFGHCF